LNSLVPPPALRCSEVRKTYAGRLALDDISFTLEAGASTALVGLNGAGKSTLLRTCLDLIGLDAGRIEIAGIDHRHPAARDHLAYLPERFVPPHYLSGRELLRTLLALHGIHYDETAATAECRALNLDIAALSRRARDYSKGMAQKLGLAACLLAQRSLMILDEPFSGLDPLARRHCGERLLAEKARGTTLFFSTHSFHELTALCDRVVVMHAGRIVFDDTLAASRCAGDPEQAFLGMIQPTDQERGG
jgi:ABC-type multidrug transport system ATPase subunit